MTGAGRIALCSQPRVISHVERQGAPWTLEELGKTLPETLLHGYESITAYVDWGKQVDPVIRDGLFPLGKPVDGIPGETYLSMLLGPGDASGCTMGNVTFGEGVMNCFHTHDTWQVLVALDGVGYYEEEGKEGHFLYPGQIQTVAPGVRHRHGAAPGQCFRQLGIVLPR